jgi:hypothetical protein
MMRGKPISGVPLLCAECRLDRMTGAEGRYVTIEMNDLFTYLPKVSTLPLAKHWSR